MANEIPSVIEVGGLIPNFWFDAIGRIVPGLLLIGEMLEAWYTANHPTIALSVVKDVSAAQIAAACLLLAIAAYLVGFLMGALSDLAVVKIWDCASPLPRVVAPTRRLLRTYFGSAWYVRCKSMTEFIIRARDLCSFFIWHRDPKLAVIFSRWDAEALASRSILVAGFLGLMMNRWLFHCWRGKYFYVILMLLAARSFWYYRRRALESRFQMLLVLHAERIGQSATETSPLRG
jgi:hypothetical protein